MDKKVALVLSGGGAWGAFQYAAEKYVREKKGYRWDVVAGVSVGALNGFMLAMEKYDRLSYLWNNISNDQVFTGGLNLWAAFKILLGAKSALGNKPLSRLISKEFEPDKFNVDLMIGAVSLRTGMYKRFMLRPPVKPENRILYEKAILASTAIPLVWKPVKVSEEFDVMVDGGVKNISPLGDVLDTNPTEVVIINCFPEEPPVYDKSFRDVLDIGMQTMEIVMNEIVLNDLRTFLRINRIVLQAIEAGVTLYKDKEKKEEYKYIKAKIIQPVSYLGDMLSFKQEDIQARISAGREAAKKAFEEEELS